MARGDVLHWSQDASTGEVTPIVLRDQYLLPNLRMRALVSISSCNAHGYDVRFDSTDPHVLADGRKLRLTPQGGLFVTTTSQFRDLHAGNEDKLRSTISANCGTVAASAVKFSSKTPVTGGY